MVSSPLSRNSVDGIGDYLAYATLLNAHKLAFADGNPYLTAAGEQHLMQLIRSAVCEPPNEALRPSWNRTRRQLWLGDLLLKEFRRPARSQQEVLDVLQERGWSNEGISFPRLADEPEELARTKARLHATLRNLNNGLPRGSIWFHGDGTGLGIRWELLADPIVTRPRMLAESQIFHLLIG